MDYNNFDDINLKKCFFMCYTLSDDNNKHVLILKKLLCVLFVYNSFAPTLVS